MGNTDALHPNSCFSIPTSMLLVTHVNVNESKNVSLLAVSCSVLEIYM